MTTSHLREIDRQRDRLRDRFRVILMTLLSVVCTLSSASTLAQDAKRRVAVLDFKNEARLSSFELNSLTAIVRASAARLSGYTVMTKENIRVLLPPDTAPEDCVGTCEVETGKLLGAAFIITGEVGRVENQLQLSMRLFNTTQGSLLGSEVVIGANILSVQRALGDKAQSLLAKLSVASTGASAASGGSSILLKVSPKNTVLSLNGGPLYLKSYPKKGDSYLIRLKPGKYTLRGEASGYLSQEEPFLLSEGGLIEVRLELSRALKRDTSCDPADPKCRGELLVYTRPAGAQLWVDGLKTQYTTKPSRRDPTQGSVSLSLSPGEHVVEARLAKYRPAKQRITVIRDDFNRELQKKPLVLQPNFGALSITSQPSGATVFMDDKMVGTTPWSAPRVDAGPHKLRLFKEEYRSVNEVVIVRRGETETQTFKLEPTFAELSVQVSAEGSPLSEVAVMIDQKLVGRTDIDGKLGLGRQPEGSRQLQLLHPLYAPEVRSIEVKAGASKVEAVSLKPAYATLSVKVKGGVRAKVELDGESIGDAPLTKRVSSGNVVLNVTPYDTAKYSPVKKKLALSVKERLDYEADCGARLGKLMIITNPPEADVSIDGKKRGVSPLTVELFQGEHEVSVSAPDFASVTQTVEVTEGELEKVRLEMSEDPQVKVTCEPGGVVFVDGERIGRSPQVVTRKPGRYEVACEYLELRERSTVSLSDQREEVTLRIMPERLKAQEDERSSRQVKMWFGVVAASALGGLAFYDGVVQVGDLEEKRDAAIARLDADKAWSYDEDAQSMSTRGKVWAGLSGAAAMWSLYQLIVTPPAVEFSTEVKAQAWQPVISPMGVGVMGSF